MHEERDTHRHRFSGEKDSCTGIRKSGWGEVPLVEARLDYCGSLE